MMKLQRHCGATSARPALLLLLAAGACAPAHGWAWTSVATSGTPPGPRVGAAASVWAPNDGGLVRIVVCGGRDASGALVAGCSLCVPGTPWQYAPAVAPAATAPRADACAIVYGDFLLLFGGNTSASDPSALEAFKVGAWARVSDDTTGTPPTPRYGHTCVLASVVMDGSGGKPVDVLIVFGGRTLDGGGAGIELSDVAVLTLGDGLAPTYAWTAPQTTGLVPAGRHFHACAVTAAGDAMLVAGGMSSYGTLADVWLLTLTAQGQWHWKEQQAASTPSMLSFRAVTVGAIIVFIGGTQSAGGPHVMSRDGARFANDTAVVHYLDTTAWAWYVPSVDGSSPSGVDRPSVVLITPTGATTPQAVVYGGATRDGVPTDALYVLSDIGVTATPVLAALPYILGGCAVAVFILAVLVVIVVWQRRAAAAAQTSQQLPLLRAAAPGRTTAGYYATDVGISPSFQRNQVGLLGGHIEGGVVDASGGPMFLRHDPSTDSFGQSRRADDDETELAPHAQTDADELTPW